MFWKDKDVVVTGGSGLIGTPMMEMLADQGAMVTNINLPVWDITNLADMRSAFNRPYHVCIHLAAMSHVEKSREAGIDCFETNVMGTWNVLEACLQRSTPVVIASSNHVYGRQEVFPVAEDAPLNQLDTYSASKVAADHIARAYAHNYQLPVAVVRNTNCFGPRDMHTDHLVPGTIMSILNGQTPVLRSRGLIKKGYLYVDDVVDSYLLVAQKLLEGEVDYGSAYNVGGYGVISSQDMVETICKLMDVNYSCDINQEPNDQHHEQMDSTKIYQLGWKPKHTLEMGLVKTINWFRDSMVTA